jgi:hypothetical protein
MLGLFTYLYFCKQPDLFLGLAPLVPALSFAFLTY